MKSRRRRTSLGFSSHDAVIAPHLAGSELEPRLLLAADLEIFDVAVYDFSDITVRDLGIKDHIPVLVGDMWDSVDQRQEGRVLMGDGNGGFDMMEVGSLGDGDTFVRSVSATGMFIGGNSDSSTSEGSGQGFVSSSADPTTLSAVDYLFTDGPLFTNPVEAIGDSGRFFGSANGFLILYESDLDGAATPLSDGLNVSQFYDTEVNGTLQVGFSGFQGTTRPILRADSTGTTFLPEPLGDAVANGVSEDGLFIIGESITFDFDTFQTVTRVSLWQDIDGIIESPADQTGADYEQIILQTPDGDFQGEGLSVTTLDDGSWLASGTSEDGAWIYQEGMDGPLYLADILADEGADLDWAPQAVERVRYDSETGWLHMAVSGSSYYVGLQIAEPDVNNGPIGNIDGDSDFDANDSFLMQLILLAGTDEQIDQSKGSSSLTASQIREAFAARSSHTDVDGDGDTDANDGFLIHLVQLSGTIEQIELSKGASSLSAAEIRVNVNALGNVNDSSSRRAVTSQSVPHPSLTVPVLSSGIAISDSSGPGLVGDADRDRFWQDGTEEFTSPTSRGPGSALSVEKGNGKQSFRHWIDVL